MLNGFLILYGSLPHIGFLEVTGSLHPPGFLYGFGLHQCSIVGSVVLANIPYKDYSMGMQKSQQYKCFVESFGVF